MAFCVGSAARRCNRCRVSKPGPDWVRRSRSRAFSYPAAAQSRCGSRSRETATGNLWHTYDCGHAGAKAEGLILRHVELNPDDVAMHDGEHEGTAGRVRLHQAADIDVALRDHPVEWCDDTLISFLLTQDRQLRLLGLDVCLRDIERALLCLQSQAVGVALLLGDPPLLDQLAVAAPCHLSEVLVSLCLTECGLHLRERRLCLCDLMVELRRGDLGEKLPGLDVVADSHLALVDVSARSSEDVGRFERFGRPWPFDRHLVAA